MKKKRVMPFSKDYNFNNVIKEEKNIELLERKQLKKLFQEDKKINKLEQEEEKVERLTKKELQELQELKKLEQEISKSVKISPLRKITTRDMARGLVGSFFGIVAHFAFIEGVDVVEKFHITMFRASLLLFASFVIGFIFLYATGYREIKDTKILSIMPIRIFVIFGISIVSILSVLALFGIIGPESTFTEVYKQVAVISLPAMIGAATADLIGNKND